ncbi:MAG: hypothetical protein LBI44_01295 [Oscillospiraceae bacterium]|jgi:uncharacterized lipoprotein YehR (DUF1307 family)|nr:hypothetical protein [Oscillospiraceae bacterium]
MRTAKILMLVLALVMALILVACSNGGTPSGGTSGGTIATPTPSPTQGGTASPSQDPSPDPTDGNDSPNDSGSGWSSGVFNADDVRAEDFAFTKNISGDTITITVYDKNLREDYAITEDRLSYGLDVNATEGNYYNTVFIFNASSSPDNPGVLKERYSFARDYGENALNIDYEQRKITFTVKLDRLLEPGVDESWNDYEWWLEAFYSVERVEGEVMIDVQSSGRMQIHETQ